MCVRWTLASVVILILAVAGLVITARQPDAEPQLTGQNQGETLPPTGGGSEVPSSNERDSGAALATTTTAAPRSSVSGAQSSQNSETISAPKTREVGGLAAGAYIGTNAKRLLPSEYGLFPSQAIGFNDTVSVKVEFPSGSAGDLVIVQAEDGGQIDGIAPVARKTLDSQRALAFTFTSTAEGGIYRITLRNGFDEKRLEFTTLSFSSTR